MEDMTAGEDGVAVVSGLFERIGASTLASSQGEERVEALMWLAKITRAVERQSEAVKSAR